jgi:hypothetical protein
MKFNKNHFLETVRQYSYFYDSVDGLLKKIDKHSFVELYLFMKEKSHRLFATFAAGTVLYFLAVSAVAGLGIDARFRNPVNAFIIMFAFYSPGRLWGRFASNRG